MATRREPEEAVPAQGELAREVAGEPTGEGDAASTATLLRGILAGSGHLLRQEVELARVEIAEKLSLLQRQLVSLAAASALLAAAVFFLLSALDRGLGSALGEIMDRRIAAWLAPLILAVTLGLAGAWLLRRARKVLDAEGLLPEETMRSLKENTTWIKERLP